ncbi:E3 ubiquitin-protein ligase BRE1-like 2 [Phalaenopsis equestris]|uniref:E3 ubiquitin-protein ligase BRE1-like 2 n=1 Tax=Phalaenopsis equestris TaxID=78828 RepID=UPI0009E39AD8|nr:E3 ubiquitin-protein ligase BRE1-like 2 [Phalaenopsis equestris]XP_020586059.1 E3 ubiquitin-protein ligase BRE1-like 2 [Phalaenopsis equestris]XP_020586060.1 E3 ubiquitin-protein ligase BRE1-like 2 [Phalaenopsis equestris]
MASGERENPTQSEEVDAAALQYQNQQFVQQLEAQKRAMHELEKKCKELQEKKNYYDRTLMALNKKWNQLVDDMVLLGLRAGGDPNILHELDHEYFTEDILASFPPEEIFLRVLLRMSTTQRNGVELEIKHVQDALALRHSWTINLMKNIEEMIIAHQDKMERLAVVLHGTPSSEEIMVELKRFDASLREEVRNLHAAISILHQLHTKYAEEISYYEESKSKEQSEIKHLSSELEESMAELEESRRKLVILQLQKKGTSAMNYSLVSSINGSSAPGRPGDRTITLRQLKDSIEEAKMLASNREFELQEAREDNLTLSKQLEDLENQLKDDKYVFHSKPYVLLEDQLQHLNAELERYKGLIQPLLADRNQLLKKLRELSAKSESFDIMRASCLSLEAKANELELQILKQIAERNDLEMKLEEAVQDSERNDIKDEIHAVASALSKEMQIMEAQLRRSKVAAAEALSLRHEVNSLTAKLEEKIAERKSLSNKCAEQTVEIKSLKDLIEKLEKDKQELQIFLDMFGQEPYDNRTIMEIKESEQRARMQAEILKNALDEHNLELRVKAANEAEVACQQRLFAAEAEIAELQEKLDTSERDLLELTEFIRVKDEEAEAYISEIETIGQAYEDMQSQHQRLTLMVAERDKYNIELVSDSVRMKQAYSSLLSDKNTKMQQLTRLNTSNGSLKSKLSDTDDRIKSLLAQAAKTSVENRQIAITMSKTKLELADSEKELKWLRSAVDSTKKEHERNQERILNLRMELERERSERKKLEEEYDELKNEVMELSPERQEMAIQKLQDEIKECKAILKCGVCFDRPKEVVITKCFHLFCNPCIQRNLEIRHRKCPGCGTPFGQNDVREVNI